MPNPSLLWTGDVPPATIARQSFIDCALTTVLSAAVLDVLARPCSRTEILLRQAIFVRLRDAEAGRFSALIEALDRLAGAHHTAANAATRIEDLYLRTALLRCYADLYPSILALAQDGCLTPSHAAFWPTQATEHTALTAALPKIEVNLRKLGEATMTCDDRSGWRLNDATDIAQSTTVRASACASALALSLPTTRPMGLRLDEAFSNALADLHRETVEAIEAALAQFADLPIPVLLTCRDELQFYTAVCTLLRRAEQRGLAVTMPTLADTPTYDAIGLADPALLAHDGTIVQNDAHITSEHRFFFLTGANGGGKTTYLRTLVSNLLLALGGCPVLAERATVYPWRAVATHFPADEQFSGSGRFVDEQNRADAMAELARTQGDDCFFCFNETFSGTDHAKGLTHAKALARTMADAGVAGLFVTHFHEVVELGLPMLCTVLAGDDNRRTYRIVEQAGIGSSFARDILRKYGLDAASLAARADRTEVTV